METEEYKILPTHNGLRELKTTVGDSEKRSKAIQAITRFKGSKHPGSDYQNRGCCPSPKH